MYGILSVFMKPAVTFHSLDILIVGYSWTGLFDFFSYALYDLHTQNSFVVDLQLLVCWETYKDCVMTVSVLQKMFLPKQQCTGKAGFEVPCK